MDYEVPRALSPREQVEWIVGYEVGFQRGWNLGFAEVTREIILTNGCSRFGPADEATVAALQAVTDPDRLLRIRSRGWTIATGWDDLLATP